MKLLSSIFDIPNESKIALYGIGKFSDYLYFILSIKRKDLKILVYISSDDSSFSHEKTRNNIPIISLSDENNLIDEVDYILMCDDYIDTKHLESLSLPDYYLFIKPDSLSIEIQKDLKFIHKRLGFEYLHHTEGKDFLVKLNSEFYPPRIAYNNDSLLISDKNLPFITDEKFIKAYQIASSQDNILDISYRAYICCWAAQKAKRLEGDFVECGVNKGILSRTIVEYIDFYNIPDKKFYLFDTYKGLVESQLESKDEIFKYEKMWKDKYSECYEEVKNFFKDFGNVELVRGTIPESLSYVNIDKVAYLSIDMNCAYPELETIKYFWNKLVSGAVVILDDYAWVGCESQKDVFDKFCSEHDTEVLTLPTGQGMIIKP